MNYRDVTGDGGKINLDFGEIALSGKELLGMVREWREMLGEKCGVLDNYLAGVLNAMSDTTDASEAANEGFDALSALRVILRNMKEGKEAEAQSHPFYPQIKAYMDAHPFPQDSLYYDTYSLALFPEYLTFSVNGYLERCNDTFQEKLKKYHVPQNREALLSAGADITEEALDYLNNLIARVLAWVTPSSVFMQGMADQLILSLITQDKKSGAYVFRRLLDGTVAYE